jgi:hypothetical protein
MGGGSAASRGHPDRPALGEGAILRTHVLRGTWQLIAAADIRWLLALVGPRVIARNARRYRELELDSATLRRSNILIAKALGDSGPLTRDELATALGQARISTAGQRLAYLLQRAELDAVVCSGARRGKQSSYALLDRRAPHPRRLFARDEALAQLARRYFQSRGPATVEDFAWWSGLTSLDAWTGLESVRATLVSEVAAGRTYWSGEGRLARSEPQATYLLPAFDEYLVAYRDREAVLDPEHARRLNAGGGVLDPCVVVGGHIIGTWRRVLGRSTVAVELDLFEKSTQRQEQALAIAVGRYGAFLGLEASIVSVAIRGKPLTTTSRWSRVPGTMRLPKRRA